MKPEKLKAAGKPRKRRRKRPVAKPERARKPLAQPATKPWLSREERGRRHRAHTEQRLLDAEALLAWLAAGGITPGER